MNTPLQAVLEVSLLFARERDMGRLLELITAKAVEITFAERGCIALSKGDMLVPKAVAGLRLEEGERISNTLAREVLQKKTAQMWEDLQQDPIANRAQSIMRQQLRSAMCAPLLLGGQALGVLYVDATTRGHYTSSDLVIFQALASQAAVAIENAQFLQEIVTDPLSGLYSAGVFHRRLSEEVGRHERYGRPLALLVADVTGLQSINDAHGYEAGNKALLVLSGLLRSHARGDDIPCRCGGDEFALIMPETGPELATSMGSRVSNACAAISPQQVPGWRGASFATATFPEDGDAAEALIATAYGRIEEGKH